MLKEHFKFFAFPGKNDNEPFNWGGGGDQDGNFTPEQFDPPIIPGLYDVIFDESKDINTADEKKNH